MVFVRKICFARKLQVVSKAFYASSGAEHFEGKHWQKPDLFDLWAVSEKLLISFRNILSGVVNTAFHMSREKLWDKRVLFPKMWVWLSFLILNEKIPDWRQKFSTWMSKTKSMWPEENLDKNFFWKKVQLYILWWFTWGNSDLQEDCRFVSKAFCASSGTF